MECIEIDVYIHASPEKVWEAVSDHEGYAAWKGVKEARLLKPGLRDRNGVGAVRKVRTGPVTFVEDIVGYDPPRRLEYRVVECTLPIRHELGRMDLIPRGEGTEVHWVTTFEPKLPVGGGLMAKVLKPFFQAGFLEALLDVKKRLEGSGA